MAKKRENLRKVKFVLNKKKSVGKAWLNSHQTLI